MFYTNPLSIILLDDVVQSENSWWLIVISILGGIGTFYNVIKSTYELNLKNKQEKEIKTIEVNHAKQKKYEEAEAEKLLNAKAEALKLQERISSLEEGRKEDTKLIAKLQMMVTALSSSILMVYDKIKTEENDEGADHLLKLVKEAQNIRYAD